MKKRIKLKRSRQQQAEDISRAGRKLHQELPRHSVIASGKLYDRRREKRACRDIDD